MSRWNGDDSSSNVYRVNPVLPKIFAIDLIKYSAVNTVNSLESD